MKKPDVIEKEILELKKQLKETKKHYQYEFLCGDNWSDEMIGFFNIGNTKKILTLLNEGRKLLYKHSVFGNYIVYMNQQRNRILVKNEDGTELETYPFNGFENSSTIIVYKSPINEDTIISYIIWHSGDWYLKNEE